MITKRAKGIYNLSFNQLCAQRFKKGVRKRKGSVDTLLRHVTGLKFFKNGFNTLQYLI